MIVFSFTQENLQCAREKLSSEYEGAISIQPEDSSTDAVKTQTSISFDIDNRVVILRSAIGNPIPLFWGWKGNELIVADNANMVLKIIKGSSCIAENDFDKVGLIEAMLFDGPLSERTLFECVKKVQCAEQVELILAEKRAVKSWRWLPKIQTNPELTNVEIESLAKHHLSFLMEKISLDDVVLPITGGLDSRLLAVLLKKGQKSSKVINTYTFQRGWSFETWCAKKVTEKLSLKHFTFNLDSRCYKDFAKEVVRNSGGMITGMHTHGIYCCEKLLPDALKKLPRIFGYFGDPITGAMTESVEDGLKVSTPQAVFEKYRSSLYPQLVDIYRDEIISDLNLTYNAFLQSGCPAHTFHEFWKIQQRQNNLITHLFHYHRAHMGVQVIEPFIDEAFIDFFLSLPFEHRLNRKLFKNVSKLLFPEVFSLVSMHFSSGSLLAKLEKLFDKLESAANKINSAQEVLLNPFRYEQHQKNLQNYLSDDIVAGVEAMTKIFSVPAVDVHFPLWRYSGTEKECYRLAALSYLLESKCVVY